MLNHRVQALAYLAAQILVDREPDTKMGRTARPWVKAGLSERRSGHGRIAVTGAIVRLQATSIEKDRAWSSMSGVLADSSFRLLPT